MKVVTSVWPSAGSSVSCSAAEAAPKLSTLGCCLRRRWAGRHCRSLVRRRRGPPKAAKPARRARLRRAQGPTRAQIAPIELKRGRYKVHPLFDWSDRDIGAYFGGRIGTKFAEPFFTHEVLGFSGIDELV